MASTIGFTTCVMGTWEILLTYTPPITRVFSTRLMQSQLQHPWSDSRRTTGSVLVLSMGILRAVLHRALHGGDVFHVSMGTAFVTMV